MNNLVAKDLANAELKAVKNSAISLLGANELRRLAASQGLRPSKKWGQNFMHDPNTIRKIVQLAGVQPGQTVLEVGPGLGSLTLGLLAAGANVLAVEVDERLATSLPGIARAAGLSQPERLTVVNADALRATPAQLTGLAAPPTALVANLPYNVSVPVLLRLLEVLPSLATGLVLVQAEVARRLAAPAGTSDYGSPSAKLAWYCQAQVAAAVSRQVFWPVPGVDSLLLSFVRHNQFATQAAHQRNCFAVIDAGFNQRRKMLRSCLPGLLNLPRNQVATALLHASQTQASLAKACLTQEARAEDLSITQFLALTKQLYQKVNRVKHLTQ